MLVYYAGRIDESQVVRTLAQLLWLAPADHDMPYPAEMTVVPPATAFQPKTAQGIVAAMRARTDGLRPNQVVPARTVRTFANLPGEEPTRRRHVIVQMGAHRWR